MSIKEQKEVSDFVNNQLYKGYIEPSKLSQISPVFFIPKKDEKKHMIQGYWYLNQWTVKNNYLLPLISQLIKWFKGAKLFTKNDLQ